MRLIIRSQLIPIPIIGQLGPVDQDMPFNHFPVAPSLKTSFLPSHIPSPKLLADQQKASKKNQQCNSPLYRSKHSWRTGPSLKQHLKGEAQVELNKGEWREVWQREDSESGLPTQIVFFQYYGLAVDRKARTGG